MSFCHFSAQYSSVMMELVEFSVGLQFMIIAIKWATTQILIGTV